MIYISIHTSADHKLVEMLKERLEDRGVSYAYYAGGEYNPDMLNHSDKIVLVPYIDKDNLLIGRGMADEFIRAASKGKQILVWDGQLHTVEGMVIVPVWPNWQVAGNVLKLKEVPFHTLEDDDSVRIA